MARTTSIPTFQQASPLLDLPPELRNYLYQLVCLGIGEAVIAINTKRKPSISALQHPLSRTCRQLRKEFSPVAVQTAKSCEIVKLRCKNFNMPSTAETIALLRKLPPLSCRQHVQEIIVDDKNIAYPFESVIKRVLGCAEPHGRGLGNSLISCKAHVRFDNTKLDYYTLRRLLTKLDREAHRLTPGELIIRRTLEHDIRFHPQRPHSKYHRCESACGRAWMGT